MTGKSRVARPTNSSTDLVGPIDSKSGHRNDVLQKLRKLQTRIKNTSNVRFAASKRISFDYKVAQITIVVLSLWAIVISFLLAIDGTNNKLKLNEQLLEPIGILLPVFIVAFSLIENGSTFLRAYQLEMNARQLRELGDNLYANIEENLSSTDELINVYRLASERYNDCLERSPVNHDDVDHFSRKYFNEQSSYRQKLLSENIESISDLFKIARIRTFLNYQRSVVFWFFLFLRRQIKRITYIVLAMSPAVSFYFH